LLGGRVEDSPWLTRYSWFLTPSLPILWRLVAILRRVWHLYLI
jgi:hypothetical protein